jgi:hypothetical protein
LLFIIYLYTVHWRMHLFIYCTNYSVRYMSGRVCICIWSSSVPFILNTPKK